MSQAVDYSIGSIETILVIALSMIMHIVIDSYFCMPTLIVVTKMFVLCFSLTTILWLARPAFYNQIVT